MAGYIKLPRSMLDWELYGDTNAKVVYLHLLLTAAWEPKECAGITLQPGQCLTTIPRIADEVRLSEKQVRGALERIQRAGCGAFEGRHNNTLITLEKWCFFNGEENEKGIQRAAERASKGRPTGQSAQKEKERSKEKEKIKTKNYKEINKTPLTPLGKTMEDFAIHRKALGKPMSDRSRELILKRLETLAPGDETKQVAILEQSIANGWQGVFALKDEGKKEAKYNDGGTNNNWSTRL